MGSGAKARLPTLLQRPAAEIMAEGEDVTLKKHETIAELW